jgi:hypothetical protein
VECKYCKLKSRLFHSCYRYEDKVALQQIQIFMTHTLIIHLNRHNISHLLSTLDYKRMTLPSIVPMREVRSYSAEATSVLRCPCGWKGEALNTRKHYVEVEGIAELELFCPKCYQYLCFMPEPIATTF